MDYRGNTMGALASSALRNAMVPYYNNYNMNMGRRDGMGMDYNYDDGTTGVTRCLIPGVLKWIGNPPLDGTR